GRVFYEQDMDATNVKRVEEEEEVVEEEEEEEEDDSFFKAMEIKEEEENDEKNTRKKVEKKIENLKTLNEHQDAFTCYVQHVVASTILGKDIPKEPPQWGVDSPELFLDKSFYHAAI